MKYQRLFEPITIRGVTVRNRICMTGLGHQYTSDSRVNERMTDFYLRRAQGGAGLITVGVMRVDEYGLGHTKMSMADDSCIEDYRHLTDLLHGEGARVCAQLCHQGRYVRSSSIGGKAPKAPSAVYSRYSRETPEAFTREEIRRLVEDFASAARRSVLAGFDVIEVCGSSGYLLSQFISGLTNQRKDEYGGSLENRTRFCRELFAAMREAVGEKIVLSARITGNDMMPGGGGLEEAIEHARALESAGADLINVTGGWHESPVPQITADVPRACYTYLAGAVRKEVGCYVSASNRLSYPKDAELTLALGRADIINLSRVLLADPDWPLKAMTGREDEIRHCCACNQACLANSFFGKPCECIINPEVGRESVIYHTAPAAAIKNILIVGGGPAGCEAAVRLAQRGHGVTLWEKNSRIGGQLPLVSRPSAKYEFAGLIPYYEKMLQKAGVTVICGKEAAAGDIVRSGADCVVLALGSMPRRVPVRGNLRGITVCTAAEILGEEVIPGRNVIVMGGGSVGCETAEYLAREGSLSPEQYFFLSYHGVEPPERLEAMRRSSDRTVSIAEITDRMGSNFPAGTAWPLMAELKRLGVRKYLCAEIEEASDGYAVIRTRGSDGAAVMHRIPCDCIVQAVGSIPQDSLARELKQELAGTGTELYVIGDCSVKAGTIRNATVQALEIACRI